VRFTELPIAGALVVDIEPSSDERGFFARMFDRDEFERRGLAMSFPQVSLSYSRREGTLRGLHYQVEPAPEAKLVRCTRGAMHDVVVDLRPGSPTFLRHVAVELSADNHRAIYIPAMCAHGFQALENDTETLYHIDNVYVPEAARGLRYDDPALAISWPLPVTVISEKDRAWPLLEHDPTLGQTPGRR
jgi:dTDP-4-dehydrorhamnose 3,5-epimerase